MNTIYIYAQLGSLQFSELRQLDAFTSSTVEYLGHKMYTGMFQSFFLHDSTISDVFREIFASRILVRNNPRIKNMQNPLATGMKLLTSKSHTHKRINNHSYINDCVLYSFISSFRIWEQQGNTSRTLKSSTFTSRAIRQTDREVQRAITSSKAYLFFTTHNRNQQQRLQKYQFRKTAFR